MVKTTSHQQIVKEGVYNDMQELFTPIFHSLVSHKHNACYTEHDMFNMALGVAAMNEFVGSAFNKIRGKDTKIEVDLPFWEHLDNKTNQTYQNTSVPTPHWFFKRLELYSKEYLVKLGTDMVNATIQRCKEVGMLKEPVDIAIDGHKRPCHSKNKTLLIRGKPKGGTSKMEAYTSAQIVNDVRMTLAVISRTEEVSRADAVRQIIKIIRSLNIQIRRFILDSGYYSVEILKILRDESIPYIMMVKRFKPIKERIAAYHNGTCKQTFSYTLESTQDRERIKLLIVKRKDADKHKEIADKYIVLAYRGCRRRIEDIIADIPEEYRSRWGIETGFRNMGFMRAKTRSMIPGVRWFLFMFSAALANFWMFANYAAASTQRGIITTTITIELFKEYLLQKIVDIFDKAAVQVPDVPH